MELTLSEEGSTGGMKTGPGRCQIKVLTSISLGKFWIRLVRWEEEFSDITEGQSESLFRFVVGTSRLETRAKARPESGTRREGTRTQDCVHGVSETCTTKTTDLLGGVSMGVSSEGGEKVQKKRIYSERGAQRVGRINFNVRGRRRLCEVEERIK